MLKLIETQKDMSCSGNRQIHYDRWRRHSDMLLSTTVLHHILAPIGISSSNLLSHESF